MEVTDVQNQKPENEIELEKVGVEGLKKYVIIKRPDKTYHVIVTINSYITLPSNLRGAHMSRFAESIAEVPSEAFQSRIWLRK
ncbi:MAG: GTP cyclohydrolase I FolE2 [Candidatus Aenigmarchaeota archaeon]|nr:GTP cyclohydrolase I FolE2 [Candidatus Aenigmarchaeota archaeon]